MTYDKDSALSAQEQWERQIDILCRPSIDMPALIEIVHEWASDAGVRKVGRGAFVELRTREQGTVAWGGYFQLP